MCVCVRAHVCVFLKDLGTQFSDFFLNVSYVCFASQRGAESLKPHPMYTHTYTPCIKSVSVKSRRVLGLPPLDLQNQGKGGGGAGGQRGPLMVGVHLCISFYNENYLNSTLARKSEGFLKNKVFCFFFFGELPTGFSTEFHSRSPSPTHYKTQSLCSHHHNVKNVFKVVGWCLETVQKHWSCFPASCRLYWQS